MCVLVDIPATDSQHVQSTHAIVSQQDETPSAAPLHLFFASRSVASIIFSLDNQEPLLYYKTTIMKVLHLDWPCMLFMLYFVL